MMLQLQCSTQMINGCFKNCASWEVFFKKKKNILNTDSAFSTFRMSSYWIISNSGFEVIICLAVLIIFRCEVYIFLNFKWVLV